MIAVAVLPCLGCGQPCDPGDEFAADRRHALCGDCWDAAFDRGTTTAVKAASIAALERRPHQEGLAP